MGLMFLQFVKGVSPRRRKVPLSHVWLDQVRIACAELVKINEHPWVKHVVFRMIDGIHNSALGDIAECVLDSSTTGLADMKKPHNSTLQGRFWLVDDNGSSIDVSLWIAKNVRPFHVGVGVVVRP